MSLERDMPTILEVAKLAVSVGPLGTVIGVQFAAVFQSPVVGLRFQVALPPKETVVKLRDKTNAGRREYFISQSQQKQPARSSRFRLRGLSQ